MSAMCELCENAPAEPGDCFCVPCRVEVTAMSEVVHDPVEIILGRHLPIKLPSGAVLCMCQERFDGPAYHRSHLAELIYEHFGQVGPLPRTPAAFESEEEST